MMSGCFMKEYPQNFNKGMQNPGKSKFNKMPQTEANRRVDETGVDKLELLPTHPVSTKVQETTHSASTKAI